MAELNGQLTLFDLIGEYSTPRLDYRQCLEGVKAWIVEFAAWVDGDDDRVVEVRARPRQIVFKKDSNQSRYGWGVFCDSCDGKNAFGMWGSRFRGDVVFARRPTWSDCERFVRQVCAIDSGVPVLPWKGECET